MKHVIKSLKRSVVIGVSSLAFTFVGGSNAAHVAPYPDALVTLMEVSYVADQFFFLIDQPAANCPANTWLKYDGGVAFPRGTADDSARRTNIRLLMQTLQAMKLTGSKVRVFAANSVGGYCNVENIYII
jgi:hypothetical protein